MASVNKVILLGNLGADPELRATSAGRMVCELRLATNRSYKDKENNKQDQVCWHRVKVWGELGENCKRYLSKGRAVYVEGRIDNRSYTDKQGQTRYASDVIGESVQFLPGKRGEGSTPSGAAMVAAEPAPFAGRGNDDLPF